MSLIGLGSWACRSGGERSWLGEACRDERAYQSGGVLARSRNGEHVSFFFADHPRRWSRLFTPHRPSVYTRGLYTINSWAQLAIALLLHRAQTSEHCRASLEKASSLHSLWSDLSLYMPLVKTQNKSKAESQLKSTHMVKVEGQYAMSVTALAPSALCVSLKKFNVL